MEFKLNEDQQMIHDLAKDFAETVLQPRIDEIEQGEMVEVSNGQKHPQLPHDIHQQLAECGFIGISFPEEYNGLGMGHVEQAIVIKELSRVSPSVGKCLDVYILGLEALDLYASPEQKEKYLAPCCSGEQTVSFAFTEPETGSDPKMLKTRLEKQADGTYKLNGVKRFISNAGYDGPCVLFALQKDEESGRTWSPAWSSTSSARATPSPPPGRRSAIAAPRSMISSWTTSWSPRTRSWASPATASLSCWAPPLTASWASPPCSSVPLWALQTSL